MYYDRCSLYNYMVYVCFSYDYKDSFESSVTIKVAFIYFLFIRM